MSNLAVIVNDTHYFMKESPVNRGKCYKIENILVLVNPTGYLNVTIDGFTFVVTVDKQTSSFDLSKYHVIISNVVEVGTPGWFGFTQLEIVERCPSPLDEKLICRKVENQCKDTHASVENWYPCPQHARY